MDDLRFLILYGVLAGIVLASFRKAFHDRKLDTIPVIGSSGFLSSYWDAFNIPKEYSSGPFISMDYVVCGPKLIKDIAGAPENVISFTAGVQEV
ncbi:hypothetical protein B0H14DRAFT_3470922 [Mycena olivaceomarginata]|nr:hypothetical protein B0H14DRAFT_3470922 [Mycena olivaceomarginata]